MDDPRVSSPDWQTHLIQLEAFFFCPVCQWPCPNLEKCVFADPTLEILGHTILVVGLAPTADHTATIYSCPLRISSSCKDFLSWWTLTTVFFLVCSCFAAFDWSPEGQPKNAAVDHRSCGGFSRCKAPPHQSGATSAPFPSSQASFGHWRLRFPHWGHQSAKISWPLVSPWFLCQTIVWHGIPLFHFWWRVVSSSYIHSRF